jgi:hypothetical protein
VGGASIDASRCSVVVGRSSRAPASGAITAMSDADGAANLERRAGDSVTSGNLETETDGVDASAMAELWVWPLLLSDGVGQPPWATRCTADGAAADDSLSGSGEDSALSWTDGPAMISLPLCGSVGSGLRASGKSNRGASAPMDSRPISGRVTSGRSDAARCTLRSGTCTTADASIDSRGSVDVSIDSVGEASLDCRALWGIVGRGRSIAARCTLRSGPGPIGEASIGSVATREASIFSVWGRGGRVSSGVARCTLRSGTRLIGAPSPIRRDWPRVSRCMGADGVSAGSSPGADIANRVDTAPDRCATVGSGVGAASGGRLTRR